MSGLWDPSQRAASYADQVQRGLHDGTCEQRERSYICHCGKRSRLASGLTEPPTEGLYLPPPDCPVCSGELEYDGDSWTCPKCHLSWNSAGDASSARFDDEYGNDFGGPQFGRLMRDVIRSGVAS